MKTPAGGGFPVRRKAAKSKDKDTVQGSSLGCKASLAWPPMPELLPIIRIDGNVVRFLQQDFQ